MGFGKRRIRMRESAMAVQMACRFRERPRELVFRASPSNAGDYGLVARNSFGSATSSVTQVTVPTEAPFVNVETNSIGCAGRPAVWLLLLPRWRATSHHSMAVPGCGAGRRNEQVFEYRCAGITWEFRSANGSNLRDVQWENGLWTIVGNAGTISTSRIH